MDKKESIDGLEEDVPLDPLLVLLEKKHVISSTVFSNTERDEARAFIVAEIKQHNMLPYLEFHGAMFEADFTAAEKAEMAATIEEKLKVLDAKIKDAEENLGDSEVRESLLAKCNYFHRLGDLKRCLESNEECGKKTLGPGLRVDLWFQQIRLGLAFSDNATVKKGLEGASKLIKDADWERRNRFRVYEGLCTVVVRNFEKGCRLLLEALATFAATELISFHDYIFITSTTALIQLNRSELKKSIVDSPEVISAAIPQLDALLASVYRCRYQEYFPALEAVCQKMQRNVFLQLHVNYFFREARIVAFKQFLDSYSSVTLQSMSTAFNIPMPVLDQMLFNLISNERIACKIDRVNGRVHTMKGEGQAHYEFHKIVKDGDLLLSRLQKLSRVVEL